MASTAATRIFRVCKETGRPFPKVSDDDVIDFMVLEAVTLKVMHEDNEEAKKQRKKEWKKDQDGIKRLKEITS